MIAAPTLPDALVFGGAIADADIAWRPLSAPQEAFVQATEFELLYGGAKGGAKSESIVVAALAQIHKPAYKALLLRHTFPELQELLDRCQRIYPRLGGQWHAGEMRWVFPAGASIELGYCERIEHVRRYQGREFAFIGYDEVGNQADEAVWTLLIAECRCSDPSVVCMVRGTANPGGAGHAWLKRRFVNTCGKLGGIYTDPATNLERRYIPARVTDNPILMQNEAYMSRLRALPEVTRRQLLEGDWDAGEGLALDELSRDVHLCEPFAVPQHWPVWGAYDWGFGHPFSFGYYTMGEPDARGIATVYLVDSAKGRRLLPWEQAERVKATVPKDRLPGFVIYAGHDCWNERRALGENTPTVAETMLQHNLVLVRANIDRVQGLNTMREYVSWRTPNGGTKPPRFKIMRTPGNLGVFDTLESMVTDPDRREDALKQDADPTTGEGGDDAYDQVRYALASRPIAASALDAPREVDRHPGRDYKTGQRLGTHKKPTKGVMPSFRMPRVTSR